MRAWIPVALVLSGWLTAQGQEQTQTDSATTSSQMEVEPQVAVLDSSRVETSSPTTVLDSSQVETSSPTTVLDSSQVETSSPAAVLDSSQVEVEPQAAAPADPVHSFWREEPMVRRRGFFTTRTLVGVGLIGGGVFLFAQGRDFHREADEFYARYEKARDPAEIERLYQRTTNRDVKSQVSWALGAACALSGLRLLLTRETELGQARSLWLQPWIAERRIGAEVRWP